MNTSACETISYLYNLKFGTEANLIDQDNRLPGRCDIERPLQRLVDLRCGDTQIASSNHVQWSADVFGCGLGGQSLSATRRAEKVDDEALALSLNEVIESEVLVMSLHEGLE